jgi:DNA-binding beta-propeller fold protein YncE
MVAGADVTVHIPAGAFPADVQIVITAPDLAAVPHAPGFIVVAGVGIGVSINGVPYSGTFLMPITIDVTSPKITASSEVGAWTGTAFVPDTSSTLTAGMASITMDSDAAFIVQSPTTSVTPVSGATSPVTGEPFLGEGILAGALLLGGAGAVAMSRRRRGKAAPAGPAQELPVREEAGASRRGCPRSPSAHSSQQETTTSREEKSVHGAGTRSGAVGIVIGALTAAVLAACSSSGGGSASASGQQTAPAAAKPQQIFAAPKDLLAAGQPQPNGTLWAIAGDAASKGLFDISLADGSEVGSVSVSKAATSVTESLSGVIGLALGSTRTGALELLNGSTGKITTTIPLGAPARDVIVGSDGATFYVLDGTSRSASVTIVNPRNGGVQGTVPVPLDTVSIATDPLGANLYALQPDGQVSQVAIAGGKIMTSFTTGGPGARSIALSPDGSALYVLKTVGHDANVAKVNVATESVLQVFPAPANSRQVLVSADGSELYQLVGTSSYGNIQVFKS